MKISSPGTTGTVTLSPAAAATVDLSFVADPALAANYDALAGLFGWPPRDAGTLDVMLGLFATQQILARKLDAPAIRATDETPGGGLHAGISMANSYTSPVTMQPATLAGAVLVVAHATIEWSVPASSAGTYLQIGAGATELPFPGLEYVTVPAVATADVPAIEACAASLIDGTGVSYFDVSADVLGLDPMGPTAGDVAFTEVSVSAFRVGPSVELETL